MYLKLSLLIILVPLSVHALLRGLSVEVTGDRRLTITTLDNLAERRKAGEAAVYIPTGPDGSARGIWIELSSDERGSYKVTLRFS